MKCDILRTPGLDLGHQLAQRPAPAGGPIEIPEGLEEGDVVDLADDVAEALIAVGVAAKHDEKKAGKGEGHAGAHKGEQHPAGHKGEPPATHKGEQAPAPHKGGRPPAQ